MRIPSQVPWYLGVSKGKKCFCASRGDLRLPSARRSPRAFCSWYGAHLVLLPGGAYTYTDGLWFSFALGKKRMFSLLGGILDWVRSKDTALPFGRFYSIELVRIQYKGDKSLGTVPLSLSPSLLPSFLCSLSLP